MPLFSGMLSALVMRAAGLTPARAARCGDPLARHVDRPDGRLAARGRAVEPRDVRLEPRGAGRVPLARSGRPSTRVRCARTTCSMRSAGRWPCPRCPRLRATSPRATTVACASWPCAAPATRSRCSCPLCVTLMALAEPILEVWLGDRYGDGAAALDDPRVVLAPVRRPRGHARLPRRRGPGAPGGKDVRWRCGPESGSHAGAHPGAGPRGAGARHRDPVPARVPAAAAPRPRCLGRAAGRAGAPRLAARLLAGGAARRRAGGGAAGARARLARRGCGARRGGGARLLGRFSSCLCSTARERRILSR